MDLEAGPDSLFYLVTDIIPLIFSALIDAIPTLEAFSATCTYLNEFAHSEEFLKSLTQHHFTNFTGGADPDGFNLMLKFTKIDLDTFNLATEDIARLAVYPKSPRAFREELPFRLLKRVEIENSGIDLLSIFIKTGWLTEKPQIDNVMDRIESLYRNFMLPFYPRNLSELIRFCGYELVINVIRSWTFFAVALIIIVDVPGYQINLTAKAFLFGLFLVILLMGDQIYQRTMFDFAPYVPAILIRFCMIVGDILEYIGYYENS